MAYLELQDRDQRIPPWKTDFRTKKVLKS